MPQWPLSASPRRLLIPLVLGALVCGCGRDQSAGSAGSSAPRPPRVPIPAAAIAPILTSDSLPGGSADPSFETYLAPLHDVEVFARVTGEVVSVAVEEGQRVAAGALLAQLDDRERRAALDEQEAHLARATSAWERAQKLHTQSLITDEAFAEAKADFEVTRAQRDRARIDWERCAVRAPFAGLVALRRAQLGQLVQPNDPMFRISNPDTLRAELLLPESKLGTVHRGQVVHLMPAEGVRMVTARITRVNPMVDSGSGTFRVVIDLDNRSARLRPGVSARVSLVAEPNPGRP